MTSAMFRRDYEALKAEGTDLSPEDIIRLNALAIKAHVSADCALNVHVQRAAFLPRMAWWRTPVVLREPTMAHELWLEQVSRFFALENVRATYSLYAYALSRDASRLVDPFAPPKVQKAVVKFTKHNLARLTDRQLFGAVDYCLTGGDWTAGESAPSKASPDDEVRELPSPTLGMLVLSRAYGINVTTDDLARLLPSEIEEAVLAAQMRFGLVDVQSSRARQVAAYVRTREEIRARGKKENGQHD